MGIRGLTTFVQQRSNIFFDNYELHDTKIVIDGNSIACQLYSWHCKSNDCFGGDYDKYASVVKHFFQLLKDSNVTPYVILDGGYEKRKLATILDRMKNRIHSARGLTSVTEGSVSVFPLFLRETFGNVMEEMQIKRVRCDFEGDSEVACLAKALNCPVLSYDSDYYIFDAIYIPFSTFDMTLSKNGAYNYVYCQVYRIDKFLEYFGGLEKSNLPLLAVLLGNDYIKRSLFNEFYEHLKIQKGKHIQNEQQRRIKSVIVWLQNETVNSAIKKILSRYKLGKRRVIAEQIENAIKGYHVLNSVFTKYLDISVDEGCSKVEDLKIEVDEIEDSAVNDSESEEELDVGDYDAERRNKINLEFLEKYRKCLLPPSFMDIVVQHKYYCIPQMEDHSLQPSHMVSFRILAAIYKILTNSDDNLICIARCGEKDIKHYTVEKCTLDLPKFQEIQTMSPDLRRDILLKILGIETSFVDDCLKKFPPSWHILLIALKYIYIYTNFRTHYLYSIILCAIVLNCIDKKIGFYRSTKSFDGKYHKLIKTLKPNKSDYTSQLPNCFDEIQKDDSILCMNDLIHLFQMSPKLKSNYRLYNHHIVHDLAEFQSGLIHIVYLNSLLNYPFPNLYIHNFYDGTFLYNATTNFKRRTDLDAYIKILLQRAPSVLHSFNTTINALKETILIEKTQRGPKRKRKKKKRDTPEPEQQKEPTVQEKNINDPNNMYSILENLE